MNMDSCSGFSGFFPLLKLLTKNLWKYGEFFSPSSLPLLPHLFCISKYCYLELFQSHSIFSSCIVFFLFLFVYFFRSVKNWHGSRMGSDTGNLPTFLNAKNYVFIPYEHTRYYMRIFMALHFMVMNRVSFVKTSQRRKKKKIIRNKKNGATRRMYVFGRANYSCFCFISC